ncbi:MAG: DUF3175 domain-containing protein [Bradyrhizobiaceae bacterium]|nr:MAG: DUF3175 domain-containing protein [Bradyrhizobiaceae bacterium]
MAKAAHKTTRKSASRKRTAKSSHGTRKSARVRKTSGRKTARKRAGQKWSARVTQTSDALDLKRDVFKLNSPKAIARSLKRSAEHSNRRKSNPYRSAMSMLVFYINRAGKNLSAARRKKLDAAKDELRKAFGKTAN